MTTGFPPDLPGLPLFRRGKVRDVYDLGDSLLMVASDRLSAFDVVLPTAIPGKGIVLTQLSRFWFGRTRGIVPNHLREADPERLPPELRAFPARLEGRSMIVRKAERIDIECVVRGFLAGSAWREYVATGRVGGMRMPTGMRLADSLPEPIFTPAVKADTGHDLTITVDALRTRIGEDLAGRLESTSHALYAHAATHAARQGMLIADTKFEFGFIDGELTLIDEALTPDSSRFWDASTYEPGVEPASFDKQFVRNWLEESGWDKEPPGPALPETVVAGTIARYHEAFARLTGSRLSIEAVNRA